MKTPNQNNYGMENTEDMERNQNMKTALDSEQSVYVQDNIKWTMRQEFRGMEPVRSRRNFFAQDNDIKCLNLRNKCNNF